jgi:hypothetical protein
MMSGVDARKGTSMHKTFILTAAIVALIGSNSNALADNNAPVVTQVINAPGRPPLVALSRQNRGPLLASNDAEDAGLTKIADNITRYKNSPYWGWYGYTSYGPQAEGAQGTEQWLASSFIPSANHVATKVEIPAEYYTGTNAFDLSIYNDAGGVPGTALHTWHVKNLPHAICCSVVGGVDKSGVALTGGQQYWVVLSTSTTDQTAAAIWVLTEYADVQEHGSDFDVYCSGPACTQVGYKDNAWNTFPSTLYGLAFSVLGK